MASTPTRQTPASTASPSGACSGPLQSPGSAHLRPEGPQCSPHLNGFDAKRRCRAIRDVRLQHELNIPFSAIPREGYAAPSPRGSETLPTQGPRTAVSVRAVGPLAASPATKVQPLPQLPSKSLQEGGAVLVVFWRLSGQLSQDLSEQFRLSDEIPT